MRFFWREFYKFNRKKPDILSDNYVNNPKTIPEDRLGQVIKLLNLMEYAIYRSILIFMLYSLMT
jgi:hypothetical protein